MQMLSLVFNSHKLQKVRHWFQHFGMPSYQVYLSVISAHTGLPTRLGSTSSSSSSWLAMSSSLSMEYVQFIITATSSSSSSSSSSSCPYESLTLAEMLYKTNLVGLVADGKKPKFTDNTVMIYDDATQKMGLEFTFPTTVLGDEDEEKQDCYHQRVDHNCASCSDPPSHTAFYHQL